MAEIRIKPQFKMADVRETIRSFKAQIQDQAVSVLIDLADKTAQDARQHAEFINHSHNLRSSLGTVVFKNGSIVYRNFQLSGSGSDGLEKGKSVAESNIPSSGIGMMLVAGEDYALYVEAKDNKWVISGSSMRLAEVLQRLV